MDIETQIINRISKNKPKSTFLAIKPTKTDYFYLKSGSKYDYVSTRLHQIKNMFLDALSLEDFEPINLKTDKPFFTFGMISSLSGSKIEDDVYLFNTIDDSNIPYRLNLSSLDSFSLFNGQLVAMQVTSSFENSLNVQKIFYLPTIKINTLVKENLSVSICRGFFTPEKIDKLFLSQSSALVLMGPFVSLDGPFLTFSSFINYLEEKIKSVPSVKVIIVPSTEDYMSVKVFPQPAVKVNSDKIISLSNPASFYLNNNLITVCNFDNLIDLCYEEYSKISNNPADQLFCIERMNRLAHHLVFQQSYVPCINSLSSVSYGSSLDVSCVPDIYIINSRMKHFNCKVGPCLVVNTGSSSSKFTKITTKTGNKSEYNTQDEAFE